MRVLNDLKNKHIVAYFEEETKLKSAYTELSTEDIITALGALHHMLVAEGIKDAQYTAMLDAFVRTFMSQKRANPASIPAVQNTLTVKAAIRAGIIEGLGIADVDELTAGQVTQFANDTAEALKQSFAIPKA